MTMYIDLTGTLGRERCTSVRLEPDLWHGVAPEQAARAVAAMIDEHPPGGQDDEAGATVVSIGESHESVWLVALVAGLIAAALHAEQSELSRHDARSVWVTSDDIRSGTAICVHPVRPALAGERRPYRRADDAEGD